jgi:hypothetical protein
MAATPAQSVHVRLPRGLYELVKTLADEQDVSMNTLAIALLSGATGWTLNPEHDHRLREPISAAT